MKNLFRRIAVVLIAGLLLFSSALAAEQTATLVVPSGNGNVDLPVAVVAASDGTIYYWVDIRALTPEEQQALPSGGLEVHDNRGSLLYEAGFAESGAGTVMNWPIAVYDTEKPEEPLLFICASEEAPSSAGAMDAWLMAVGFTAESGLAPEWEEEPEEESWQESWEEPWEEFVEEPIPEPTIEPTPVPTEVPTPIPTEVPTPVPTEVPTPVPTEVPTPVPTEVPTPVPTEVPTPVPTEVPTPVPTEIPTPVPTETPTPVPTEVPTPTPLPSVDLPGFVRPSVDGLPLLTVPDGEALTYLDTDDVISLYEYVWTDNNLWYHGINYRDHADGWLPAETVEVLPDKKAFAAMDRIDAERATPVPTEAPTPAPTEESIPTPANIPELAEEPNETLVDEISTDFTESSSDNRPSLPVSQPVTDIPEYAAPAWDDVPLLAGIGGDTLLRLSSADVLTVQDAIRDDMGAIWLHVRDYRTGTEGYLPEVQTAALSEARAIELESGIDAGYAIQPEEPTHTWAVTDNSRGGTSNNVRSAPGTKASVVTTLQNGILVQVGDAESYKGQVWYPVTIPETGEQGYMRDYLLRFLTETEAEAMLVALSQPETPIEEIEFGDPEAIETKDDEPEEIQHEIIETQETDNKEMNGAAEESEAIPIVPDEATVSNTPVPTDKPVETSTSVFPLYAIAEDQPGITIVLRPEPAGDIPSSGALPTITEPTPVVVTAQKTDEAGGLWYLATVLNDTRTGYVQAEKLRFVTREEAEDAIYKPEITPVPPVETPTAAPTATPEPTPEPTLEPTPTPTPEPPQQLTEGGVYHYGLTTGQKVNVRKEPKKSADTRGRLEKGSIIWVKEMLSADPATAWCAVRTDLGDGYIQAQYIQLLGEQEEQLYIATLDDPEVAPEPTIAPTATPAIVELITPEPSASPEATSTPELTPEITATPEPTPKPTETPAPVELRVYARVISDNTPLRGNQDPNAYLQTMLRAEDVVYILNAQQATDGMTWYLCQYGGMYGFIRADLLRIMGEQETDDYLARLQEAEATPTPLPQSTPEPYTLESTSAYVLTRMGNVNLRKTPSGTSLGRLTANTLLLVTDTVRDNSGVDWYAVSYNGKDGYIRADMAEWLTIGQLQEYLAEQQLRALTVGATPTPQPDTGSSVSYTIAGTSLIDTLPVDGSWSTGTGLALSVTPSPSPIPTPSPSPTPVPPEEPANLLSRAGNLTVYGVPAKTSSGEFSIYGMTDAFAVVTANATYEVQPLQGTIAEMQNLLIAKAFAESVSQTQTETRGVGSTRAGADGRFSMDIRLPAVNRNYELAISTTSGGSVRYMVTRDDGTVTATPEPTVVPLPTAEPVQERGGGLGILPFAIAGGLLILLAAGIYGYLVYRRRSEEEEEADEEEDEYDPSEESAIRQSRLDQLRGENVTKDTTDATSDVPEITRKHKVPVHIADEEEVAGTDKGGSEIPDWLRKDTSDLAYRRPEPPVPPTPPEPPVKPQEPDDSVGAADEQAPRRRRRSGN